MTPGARVAAAIEVLDAVLTGASAEKTLTNWARRSRFAGSGDRAAVRDLVFDALRCLRSYAWLGGSQTGRGLMIGALRANGTDPSTLFTGVGHAPTPVSNNEDGRDQSDAPEATTLDAPEWLLPQLGDSLGADLVPVMQLLRQRAAVFLRVNLRKNSRDAAQLALAGEGIETEPHLLSPTALRILSGPRKLKNSQTYLDGRVEVQDAASQAVVDLLPLQAGAWVLDYCAGGGGKALAIAAHDDVTVLAHDVDPRRMSDLPVRAARAGVTIDTATKDQLTGAGQFDLVLCDAPCSGSGAWRRSPEAKWRLDRAALDDLLGLQASILRQAQFLVKPRGRLAYVTCSLLNAENQGQIDDFLGKNKGWRQEISKSFTPTHGGDGFYVSVLVCGDIPV